MIDIDPEIERDREAFIHCVMREFHQLPELRRFCFARDRKHPAKCWQTGYKFKWIAANWIWTTRWMAHEF